MRIDHVIYATSDLEGATARLATQLGIAPSGGGRHDRIGTHNEIFALGGGYLEVLAVVDAEEAAASGLPFFIARDEGIADPARLSAWLGDDTLPVRAVAGDRGVAGVGIGTGELR